MLLLNMYYTSYVSSLLQVKKTFGLLDGKRRKRLLTYCGIQIMLSFLELCAMLAIGLFSYAGSAYLGLAELPTSFYQFLNKFGLVSVDLNSLMLFLISIAVILMILKSLLSLLFLKKTFLFLAVCSAEISKDFASRFFSSSFDVINGQPSQESTYSVARGLHLGEILGGATVVVSEIAMISLLSCFILFTDLTLAISLFLYFLALYLLSQKTLGGWMRSNSAKFASSTVNGDEVFQDGISMYRELLVAQKIQFITRRFSNYRFAVANATANMQLIGYIPKLTFEPALILGTCLVGIQELIFGSGENAITVLMIFFASGSRVLPSLLRLQSAMSSIQSVSGGSEIAFNLLNKVNVESYDEDLNLSKSDHTQNSFEPSISISGLRFSYSHSDSFSIRDVNLDIKPGESIAIVGKTGSGKSTLADLILGVLVPSSGSVRISGLDPNVVFKKWPGKIGYVPQTITFFNGTVRENVALGFEKSEVDDIQVRWCLRQVLLETFFDQREGLDTVIGERGIFLSGGQRQRLGIARALYNKPDIIILDEATSALDAETELTISKTIRELSGKKTLLVIAHRLATVQQLDRIAYMKDGQIESVGTFVEVRSKVPDFESQLRISGLQGN